MTDSRSHELDLQDLQELQCFLTVHQGGMTANTVFKVHIAKLFSLVYNSTYVLLLQEERRRERVPVPAKQGMPFPQLFWPS